MKKQLKKALISVFAFSLALSSAMIPNTPVSSLLTAEITADAAELGTYRYAGNTFEFEIVGNGSTTQIARLTRIVSLSEATCPLPSTITVNGKSYTVTEIGDDFARNANIRTLGVPNTVKSIGNGFAYGASIESLSLSSNVKQIGKNFCRSTSYLRTVSYSGKSLTELGEYAFNGSKYLTQSNNKGAVTLGDWLIKYTGTASSLRILDLSSNSPDITKIAYDAFYNNSTLKSVNLNGVQIINNDAFYNCKNLATVTDGYSISFVGRNAFYNTAWFNSEKQKNNGTVMFSRVLLNYTKLSANNTIDLTGLNVECIADNALSTLTNAKTIKLPNSIKMICSGVFGSSATTKIENIILYNTAITAANYKNNNYKTLMENSFEAFRKSEWTKSMALQRGKQILQSLGLEYVGVGKGKNLSIEKQYEIVNKLYHYVGGTYKYKFDYDGGSKNYIEELLYPKGFVCRDYTDMYTFLLELAGVNAEYMSTHGHAFNAVEIGVDWFFVDTCWYGIDNLYMVNRETVEKTDCHNVKELYVRELIPAEMRTLTGVPYCKYTLGDVNRDGQFDIRDAAMFREYLLGTRSLTANQKVLSDVNMDGAFDKRDLALMTSSKKVGSRRVGDVNGDGKINTDDAVKLQKYILGAQSLDEQSYYASDVLLDGTVDVYDLTLEKRLVIYPMGDVNMDQKINTADVTAITKFMNKAGTLTNEGKVRADVNYDGVIDGVDITLIKNMMR